MAVIILFQRRIAGQAAAVQHPLLLMAQRWLRVQRLSLVRDLALRRIAGAAHRADTRGAGNAFDRHLGPGQRAGLVAADDRGGTKRLDRGQLLDDGLVGRQALHAHRQHHRQHGGQAFRHRRHRE